jgi:hypothetical protein
MDELVVLTTQIPTWPTIRFCCRGWPPLASRGLAAADVDARPGRDRPLGGERDSERAQRVLG